MDADFYGRIMKDKSVIVIDYGMGNIWSVLGAIRYIGGNVEVSSDPEKIRKADALILPGVGSFRRAMEKINKKSLDEAIWEAVKKQGTKILGICLGMQLLGSVGFEDGNTTGLGLVPNVVNGFTPVETGNKKIPHIGFNSTRFDEPKGLFHDLSNPSDFYYVHSYRMKLDNLDARCATCQYGTEFLAAFEQDNICGTQFHPEKSQTNGLTLLSNFMRLKN